MRRLFLVTFLSALVVLVLPPTRAQASTIGFDGGVGCGDPPIFSETFTFAANQDGGFCAGFGNHSGMNFDSLTLLTTIPTVSPTIFCSPEPYFLSCNYSEDIAANTLTIQFFGLDGTFGTHHGIPVAPDCTAGSLCLPGTPQPDNFFINLNNPVCPPTGGPCTQPFDALGAGDWLTNGDPNIFNIVANVREPTSVPEPATWLMLLTGVGVLLAGSRSARSGPAAAG